MLAKAWESAQQGNLGQPADSKPPTGVDYDMWLGPAPKRPFNPVRFHGNWRWFFDYGTGDLGNDGVHRLDVARWALETAIAAQGEKPLGLPTRVSAIGGKYYFDDAQEWPDTLHGHLRLSRPHADLRDAALVPVPHRRRHGGGGALWRPRLSGISTTAAGGRIRRRTKSSPK